MIFPSLTWVLLVVSLLGCAIGFKKYIYFLSVGYGFSVALLGLTIGVIALVTGSATPGVILCALVTLGYGLRLSIFLWQRERKSLSYKKTLDSQTSKPMPLFVMVVMWLMVAVLYVMQVSPLWYRAAGNMAGDSKGEVLCYVGAVIMALGAVIEALADKQKSEQKKENPHMAATKGLYKMVRCPNYFGEILFWTGMLLSGLNVLQGWQWVISLFGYICIVFIMVDGAARLEKRQNKNYGHLKEYQEYCAKTPILLPLIPLYHINMNFGKKEAK